MLSLAHQLTVSAQCCKHVIRHIYLFISRLSFGDPLVQHWSYPSAGQHWPSTGEKQILHLSAVTWTVGQWRVECGYGGGRHGEEREPYWRRVGQVELSSARSRALYQTS